MMDEFRLYLEGKVGDVMSANPVLLHKEDGLDRLVDIFKTYHFHGCPVVDGEGTLVGIVRDTDLISMFARKDPASPVYRKVEDLMYAPPPTIEAEATIQSAIMKMFTDQTRFLVVVDRDRRIAGVVTRIDLVKGIRVEKRPPQGT